jgi:hypothetical protein
LLPRFEISNSSVPLPRAVSTGWRTNRSAVKWTLPSAALAACCRPAIALFCGLAGSSANSIVPVSFSYGPVVPNG